MDQPVTIILPPWIMAACPANGCAIVGGQVLSRDEADTTVPGESELIWRCANGHEWPILSDGKEIRWPWKVEAVHTPKVIY